MLQVDEDHLFAEVKAYINSYLDMLKMFVPSASVYAKFEPFCRDHPNKWAIIVLNAGDKHHEVATTLQKLYDSVREQWTNQYTIVYDVFMKEYEERTIIVK